MPSSSISVFCFQACHHWLPERRHQHEYKEASKKYQQEKTFKMKNNILTSVLLSDTVKLPNDSLSSFVGLVTVETTITSCDIVWAAEGPDCTTSSYKTQIRMSLIQALGIQNSRNKVNYVITFTSLSDCFKKVFNNLSPSILRALSICAASLVWKVGNINQENKILSRGRSR